LQLLIPLPHYVGIRVEEGEFPQLPAIAVRLGFGQPHGIVNGQVLTGGLPWRTIATATGTSFGTGRCWRFEGACLGVPAPYADYIVQVEHMTLWPIGDPPRLKGRVRRQRSLCLVVLGRLLDLLQALPHQLLPMEQDPVALLLKLEAVQQDIVCGGGAGSEFG